MNTQRAVGFYLVAVAIVSTVAGLYLTEWDPKMVLGVVFGVAGATVATMRGFYGHSGARFDTAFVAWYVMRPFVGGIGGLISILLLAGGLLEVTVAGADEQPVGLVVLLGLAGGYLTKDVLGRLDELIKKEKSE